MTYSKSIISLRTRLLSAVFFFSLLFVLQNPAFASYKSLYPYYNFTFGARAMSMGNAFTAVSSDLSTVYSNPAGLIIFQRPKLYLSYNTDNTKNEYDIETKNYGSYNETYVNNLDINYSNIDFFSVSVPATFLGTKWSLALSYYRLIPYNMDINAETLLSKSSDKSNIEKTISTVSGNNGIDVISLSVAFSISDYLYFGTTVQQFINTGDKKHTYSSEALDYTKEFTENIRGGSYIFGLLFIASEDVSIGFSYNTKFTETFNTSYTYTEDIETNNTESTKEAIIKFPAAFSIGVSVRLLPEWLLSYDYKKILWSKSTITGYHNTSSELPYPIRDDFSFTQTDISSSNIGTELNIPLNTGVIYIRGGLSTSKQLFSDYEAEQIKLKSYSCGLGFSFKNKFAIDLAFLYQSGKWKEKAYFQPDASVVNTVYSNYKQKVLKVSLTYNF
jgi:long-subunit fatty acid transport protein